MLTFEEKLAKYAELLIGLGVNLQKVSAETVR